MKPRQSQIDKSNEGLKILQKYNIVYFSMQERTGKTLTSILCAEKFGAKKVLVVTKKKALPDFKETLEAYNPSFEWYATNYQQVHKIQEEFDLVIIDEAHSYVSSFPDRGVMWTALSKHTIGKPLIYLSATPHAQGYHLLFNQFALSSFSPWAHYKDPLKWFNDYGIPESFTRQIKGRGGNFYEKEIPIYTNVKSHVIESEVKHLFVSGTRKELGFDYEPEDVLHYVELCKETKALYNYAVLNEKITFGSGEKDLTDKGAMRAFLHQLEGGVGKEYEEILNVKMLLNQGVLTIKLGSVLPSPVTIKTNKGVFVVPAKKKKYDFDVDFTSCKVLDVINEKFKDNVKFSKSVSEKTSKSPDEVDVKNSQKEILVEFFNCEKVNYILDNFGDRDDIVIMYHFKAEKIKLERFFKNATLLQGTANAEGVDLSKFDHLIIYSQDYSTSKYTQRRARQANFERKTPIKVHFLLSRGAVSDDVYKAVSINKRNFVDSRFVKNTLK